MRNILAHNESNFGTRPTNNDTNDRDYWEYWKIIPESWKCPPILSKRKRTKDSGTKWGRGYVEIQANGRGKAGRRLNISWTTTPNLMLEKRRAFHCAQLKVLQKTWVYAIEDEKARQAFKKALHRTNPEVRALYIDVIPETEHRLALTTHKITAKGYETVAEVSGDVAARIVLSVPKELIRIQKGKSPFNATKGWNSFEKYKKRDAARRKEEFQGTRFYHEDLRTDEECLYLLGKGEIPYLIGQKRRPEHDLGGLKNQTTFTIQLPKAMPQIYKELFMFLFLDDGTPLEDHKKEIQEYADMMKEAREQSSETESVPVSLGWMKQKLA